MEEEQISNMDLIAMACRFSKCRIDAKYFPLMFESSLIMDSLKLIYILWRNRKFNAEDACLIKKSFQESFNFFSISEQCNESSFNTRYSKRNLFLSIVFFSLMLLSGIGCSYCALIFIPLVIIFGIGLIICTCLISIKRHPLDIAEIVEGIRNSCKSELNTLKKNLNRLRSLFAIKYQIKMTNVDTTCNSLIDNQTENIQIKKKSVTFAPTLNELNWFTVESPETPSYMNSYDNNVHFFQPKF